MKIENLPKYKIGDSIVYKKTNHYELGQIKHGYLPEDSIDWEYWIGDTYIKQSQVIDAVSLLNPSSQK